MITLIFSLLLKIIQLYVWTLIIAALFSMLASFNVIDTRNRLVWSIGEFLYRVTDPVLRPIRNLLPNMGGIDISPVIAILVLQYVLTPLVWRIYQSIDAGSWQPMIY